MIISQIFVAVIFAAVYLHLVIYSIKLHFVFVTCVLLLLIYWGFYPLIVFFYLPEVGLFL